MMQFLKCAFTVLLAAPIFGSGGNPDSGVTVHEWGTFTTIADGAGGSGPWSPLGGVSDLPCFVIHLNKLEYKTMPSGPAAQSHGVGGRGFPQGSNHRMVSPRVQS